MKDQALKKLVYVGLNVEFKKTNLFLTFIQPSTETASCSTSSAMTGGPIISDVTEMSQSNAMALQMQAEESR